NACIGKSYEHHPAVLSKAAMVKILSSVVIAFFNVEMARLKNMKYIQRKLNNPTTPVFQM
ncbi:unnamed protein product, partial [marine sediment metagenome]